jgi:hypothetical protein
VDVPVVVLDVGLKVMVSPETVVVVAPLRLTEEEKPPVIVIVTVRVTVEPPWVTVRFVVVAVTVKFRMIRLTVCVRTRLPFVPVMVSV